MSISFYVGYGSKASESRGCLPATLLAKLLCGCTGIESRCKGKFLGHSFFYPHPPLFTKQYKLVPVSKSTVAGCISGKVTVTGRKQRC